MERMPVDKRLFIFCSVRYRVGMGDRVLFWPDTLIGDCPLAIQFPKLFCCASYQRAMVSGYLSRFVWGPTLRRKFSKV